MELAAPLWAEEAGFRDLGELCIELRRARLARRHTRELVKNLLASMDNLTGSGAAPSE